MAVAIDISKYSYFRKWIKFVENFSFNFQMFQFHFFHSLKQITQNAKLKFLNLNTVLPYMQGVS